MKVNRTLLAVGLFGALQFVVSAESTNLTASATEPKSRLEPIYPEVNYQLQLKKPGTETSDADKITRYGPNSSQAWTTIATRRENPTAFHDASIHEPRLVLLSFGSKPAR